MGENRTQDCPERTGPKQAGQIWLGQSGQGQSGQGQRMAKATAQTKPCGTGTLWGTLWRRWLALVLGLWLGALPVSAPVTAMDSEGVAILPDSLKISRDWWGGLSVALTLSEPLPYALHLAGEPPRLLLRFVGAVAPLDPAGLPEGVRLAPSPGGAVLTVPLGRPRLVQRARDDRDRDR